MKFSLTFNQTGDSIPFEVVENQKLFEYFVDTVNTKSINLFNVSTDIIQNLNKKLYDIDFNIDKTNEVFRDLTGESINKKSDILDYLDQSVLNKLHADWVKTQCIQVNVDTLRHSNDINTARLGELLHHATPDDIRVLSVADALAKLNCLYYYEEINLSVHRLETILKNNIEFSSVDKWKIFDNPFVNSMITNNGGCNFGFGYTYLGRQNYDKFLNFDDDLSCDDFYNFETLEFSFTVNLGKQQTIPFSKEFLQWSKNNNVKPVGLQVPIGNIVDLNKNLHEYRKILYKNINNGVSLVLN